MSVPLPRTHDDSASWEHAADALTEAAERVRRTHGATGDRAAAAASILAPVYRAFATWIGPEHPDGVGFAQAATRAELLAHRARTGEAHPRVSPAG